MFPDWLATKMADRNLTQESLAAAVGVKQQAVSMWLRGTRRPGVQSARRLAAELEVTADELFQELDESPPAQVAPHEEQLTSEETKDLLHRVQALEGEIARLRRRL